LIFQPSFIIHLTRHARGRGRENTFSKRRQGKREDKDRSLLPIQVMYKERGTQRQWSPSLITRQNLRWLTYHQYGPWSRSSQQIIRFGNCSIVGSYEVTNPQILAQSVMQLFVLLLEEILRNILNQIELQQTQERQAIIRKNTNCNCDDFHMVWKLDIVANV
jgi:hypothetical protein